MSRYAGIRQPACFSWASSGLRESGVCTAILSAGLLLDEPYADQLCIASSSLCGFSWRPLPTIVVSGFHDRLVQSGWRAVRVELAEGNAERAEYVEAGRMTGIGEVDRISSRGLA